MNPAEFYRARWVVPIESEPVQNGVVEVRGSRIAAVGRHGSVGPATGADVVDLGDVVLLPGFVNAHTHLDLTCYRGRLPSGSFWDWVDALIALGRQPGAAEIEAESVSAGVAESLAAGVTCVGDIVRRGTVIPTDPQRPIRRVSYVELISGACSRPSDFEELRHSFERAVANAAGDEWLHIGVSPHAPYTVTRDDLQQTCRWIEEVGARVAMHVGETAEEMVWLAGEKGRTADFLRHYGMATAAEPPRGAGLRSFVECGLLSASPLLVHGNHVDAEGIEILKQFDASVAWCPRTWAFFGHRSHPWLDMLRAGVNVCIGTDSLASAPSLSILDELRFVRREFPAVAPQTLFDLATLRGARALRLHESIGSLAPGKLADLTAIGWDPAGPSDPLANMLDGETRAKAVWVAGRRIRIQPGIGEGV